MLRSLKTNLLRGGVVVIAGYLWNISLMMSQMNLPIYMTSLIGLSVPIFVTIFSQYILKEDLSFKRSVIVSISAVLLFLTIFKYILSGFYPKSIILLIAACILYSTSDTLNIAILHSKGHEAPEFLKIARQESVGVQGLYTLFFAFIISLLLLLIRGFAGLIDLNLQIKFVQFIFTEKWPELILIGFFSVLMTSFSLLGLKVKTGSSVQYIKLLEPIMAGAFSFNSRLPKDIFLTAIALFSLSILNFIIDIQQKKKL